MKKKTKRLYRLIKKEIANLHKTVDDIPYGGGKGGSVSATAVVLEAKASRAVSGNVSRKAAAVFKRWTSDTPG